MSKSYNLRNRTAASALLQAPPSSPDLERHLYSDVAASRPPSPSGDRENPSVITGNTSSRALGVLSIVDVNNNNRKRYTFSSDAVGHEVNEDTSNEQEMSSPWQTVDRRRAHSLDSAQPAPSRKTGHRG